MMRSVRGRILQAYYDDKNVAIRKSRLYCFDPVEDARKVFDIFAQHMASQPVGNTRDVFQSDSMEARLRISSLSMPHDEKTK